MVTSMKGVSKEIPSDKAHQKEFSDTGLHESRPGNQDGSELRMTNKSSGNLPLTSNSYSKIRASLPNQERNSQPITIKELHDTHQRSSPDSGIHTSQSNQEGSSLSVIPHKEIDGQNHRQSPHAGTTFSESDQEGSASYIIREKASNTSQQTLGRDAGVPASESDQENFIVALRPEKGLDKLPPRRNPDSVAHASHSGEGVTFSRLPEKPTVDGYNWRKYGQKLVKGNTYVRSYYKCTFANCPARKQVERSHDGQITEINYLWKHEHPKPPHILLKGSAVVLPVQARGSDEPSSAKSEEHSSVHPVTSQDPEASETRLLSMVAASDNFVEVSVSQSSEMKNEVNNIPLDSKRQKRESSSFGDSIVTKTNYEPRVVVQTTSAVDIVNDGYRWRKYGQKLVKGNRNPRSYYRCSSAGCPVKKHVERASHDENVVITTYEGQHDHDMPAGARTVAQNTAGNNTGTTSIDDDESRPKPKARESAGTEMVVHVTAN